MLIELGGPKSAQLMAVDLNIVAIDPCRQAFGSSESLANGINDTTQICAGDKTGQMDTCEVRQSNLLKYFHKCLTAPQYFFVL